MLLPLLTLTMLIYEKPFLDSLIYYIPDHIQSPVKNEFIF